MEKRDRDVAFLVFGEDKDNEVIGINLLYIYCNVGFQEDDLLKTLWVGKVILVTDKLHKKEVFRDRNWDMVI